MMTTIEVTGVPAGYEPVAHRVPRVGEFYVNAYGDGVVECPDNNIGPRLIVRKIPPKLVPLEKPDVIIGTTLIRKRSWRDGLECVVQWTAYNSLGITAVTIPTQLEWSALQADYDYSNDHGATWQPCSKEAAQ